MKLENYKSNEFNFNKQFWKEVNIIENVNEFNTIAAECFALGTIKLTQHGHLMKERIMHEGACWNDSLNNISYNSYEFVCVHNYKIYRFVFKPTKYMIDDEEHELTGFDAFKQIQKDCKAHGININDYAISEEEAIEVKKSIPSPWIKLTATGNLFKEIEIPNVFHIDWNSAYPAGLCANYPEFTPIYEEHFKLRKTAPIHKAVINYSIGAMQSLKGRMKARYAKLSKAAIEWTIDQLKSMTEELQNDGNYNILAYNTDGIWVQGNPEKLYKHPNYGNDMGQWKIDHVCEKIRFKSAGAYEFMENGEYHAVVRGRTRLDNIKPRSEWTWGDIFQGNCMPIKYTIENNQIKEIDDEEIYKIYYQER